MFNILHKIVLYILSTCLIFIPGFVWSIALKKRYKNFFDYISNSFILNTFFLVFSLMVLKLFIRRPVSRLDFIVIIFVITFAGIGYILFGKRRFRIEFLEKESFKSILQITSLAVFSALIVLTIFHGKLFLENLDCDGEDTYTLAESLRTHIVAYGDLEHGDFTGGDRYGIYMSDPRFMDGYYHFFYLLLFEGNDVFLRLPYITFFILLFIAIYYVIIYKIPLANLRTGNRHLVIIPILLWCLLYTVIMFFYTGYSLFFAEIASDPIRTIMLTYFLLSSVYYLFEKKTWNFIIFSLFAAGTMHTGIIFTSILLFSYYLSSKNERVFIRNTSLRYYAVFSGIVAFYCLGAYIHGYLDKWWLVLGREYFDRFRGLNTTASVLNFLKYYIIFSGGISILFVLRIKKVIKDKVSFGLFLIILVYLPIVLSCAGKKIPYLAPISVFPLIIFLRQALTLKAQQGRIVKSLPKLMIFCLIVSLAAMIALSLPKKYIVHNEYRKLGAKTCLMYGSFKEAFEAVDLLTESFDRYTEDMPWLYYADYNKNPERDYEYYFTDSDKPPQPQLYLIASNKNAFLWGKSKRIEIPRTPTRKDIFSGTFRELSKRWD